MLILEDALSQITGALSPLPAEEVGLEEAFGRVLAADVAARTTHPPAAVSAMDGYAVRAEDVATVPARLHVLGEAAAGWPSDLVVQQGQAVRIFTGGQLPRGADTIVIQEDTERENDGPVTVLEAPKPGQFVRPAGLDFKEGEILLEAGRWLTARDIGLAAAMNVARLSVRKRPLVAFATTGDELAAVGADLGPGQIVNSNGVALAAYVAALGGVPKNLGIARDTPGALAGLLARAEGADMIVTSGGASVGDHDLVKSELGSKGFDLGFYKVAMRPGKPLIFGTVPAGAGAPVPFLGLPGNPVSTGVTSALVLRAALGTMLGLNGEALRPETARLGAPLGKNGKRQDFMRASLGQDADGWLTATPFPRQDSSMQAAFAKADALIIRPIGAEALAEGAPVPILRLGFGPLRF